MEDADPSEPARPPHPRGEPASFSMAACGPLNTAGGSGGGGVQEWALTNWERIRKYSPAGLGDILSLFRLNAPRTDQAETHACRYVSLSKRLKSASTASQNDLEAEGKKNHKFHFRKCHTPGL